MVYVIVRSSAGALIGLQFVVLTLITERPPVRAAGAGVAEVYAWFIAIMLAEATGLNRGARFFGATGLTAVSDRVSNHHRAEVHLRITRL